MSESTHPHPENFCGGAFQDWLEVNLIQKCNANCSWCVEKVGYHPYHVASWETIANAALETCKKNIILLGGEPTLYKYIKPLIEKLIKENRKVWITTNGSKINRNFCGFNLKDITGVNISIHHYDLVKNSEITHIKLREPVLIDGIKTIHSNGGMVRLNCNTIKGYIDSEEKIVKYIKWCKLIGADTIRFAELKIEEDNFVDLATILNYKYGLNDDPFTLGCHKEAVILGVPINFRQMCGLQTSHRPAPVNPVQCRKEVLYYDGKVYDGWQSSMYKLSEQATDELLEGVAEGKITPEEAKRLIR
jgi:organic radical activating enzyme